MEKWFLLLKSQKRKPADARTHAGEDFSWSMGAGKPPGCRCGAGSLPCPSSRWEVVQASGKPVTHGGELHVPAAWHACNWA